jgi:hypothetical protein
LKSDGKHNFKHRKHERTEFTRVRDSCQHVSAAIEEWQRMAAGLARRLSCAEAIRNQIRHFRLRRFREDAPEQRRDSAAVEVDDDLMMLHALPALHRTEITHKTIMAVAHASQSAIPEHGGSMHLLPIPSNLDHERLKNGFSICA